MNEAVEDGIGQRRVVEEGVPMFDGKLAGDECRAAVIAVIEDLEEVAFSSFSKWDESEIVDDDEVGFSELTQESGAFLKGIGA
jgi:hypothetical protein